MGENIVSFGNIVSIALVAALASAMGFVAGWFACQHVGMIPPQNDIELVHKRLEHETSRQQPVTVATKEYVNRAYNMNNDQLDKRVVHDGAKHVRIKPQQTKELDQTNGRKTLTTTAKPTKPFGDCAGNIGYRLSRNRPCPMMCPGHSRYYTMFSGMSWYVPDDMDSVDDGSAESYSLQSQDHNTDIKCRRLCKHDPACYSIIFDPKRRRCWAYFTWQNVDYDGRKWCSRKFFPNNGTMLHSEMAIRYDKMCSCRSNSFNNEDYFLISLNRYALCIDDYTMNIEAIIRNYEKIKC